MTPPRMVELECPSCHRVHWTIDADFHGKWIVGESERPYEARQYNCPHCASGHIGFRVLRKAPPEFFLQPHSMYPMSVADFAFWLEICREAFPDHHKLRSLGVYWYPGSDHEQQERLRQACEIGQVAEYRLFISNYSPDDERIEVGVQRTPGEAHFWCDRTVTLKESYFDLPEEEVDAMAQVVARHAVEVRAAWVRFCRAATVARARWASALHL
ncbi:MAG: hypothetical protein U0Q55_22410 [Vicinamibacterales bacterium]